MLRNASLISGYVIVATDGLLGAVSDILFDDTNWLVRWLVVDTGKWLPGRKVLLPPSVLGHLDQPSGEFSVRLTMQEIKDSPNIDTDRPVSRQFEADIYSYYGWSPYWGGGIYMGGHGYMGFATAASPNLGSKTREEEIADTRRHNDNPHLRSIKAVTGYHIHASDGEIGHIDDFLVEDADWSIRYLLIDTKNWWQGKEVLISPRSVREIDWADRLVNLNVSRQRVKDSPTYDSSITVDRAYEKHFHDYYGDAQPVSHENHRRSG